MHALRIGYQGLELLETGRITLPMPEPPRSALREVRAGKVALEDVLEHLDRVTLRLEVASKRRDLPAKPDIDAVDAFVVRTYRQAWG